jgi:hypothetical protein
VPLDDDLFPLNRHLDRLVLGVDLLADSGLARLHRLLTGFKLFLLDLNRLTALNRAVGRGCTGHRGCSCRGACSPVVKLPFGL